MSKSVTIAGPFSNRDGSMPSADLPVVLRVRRLNKAFDGQIVLDRLSIDLRQGEVVILKGANGSGKTTLLNILTGNLEADSGMIELCVDQATERFTFPTRWWNRLHSPDHFTPERVATMGVGRTWQDLRLFPAHSLRENLALAAPRQIGESPMSTLLRRAAVRREDKANLRQADEVLARLGLCGREHSSGDRVSLGQAKRVAIARAVRAGARILLLDEPLSGLDEPGIDQVLQLLQELARAHQMTILIVEHVLHLRRLLSISDTVWTLERGRIRAEPACKLAGQPNLQQPLQEWCSGLVGASEGPIEEQLPSGASFTRVANGTTGQDSAHTLDLEKVVISRGSRPVLGRMSADTPEQGLSLTLSQGDLVVLRAPNGWGKTTLLDAIAGLIPVTSGTVWFRGRQLQSTPAWQRARLGISMLQARSHVFPHLTAGDTLRLAGISEVPTSLRPLLRRQMATLSGGERQRVAITCACGAPISRLLLLDEPFSMLDQQGIVELRQLLNRALAHAAILMTFPNGYQMPH